MKKTLTHPAVQIGVAAIGGIVFGLLVGDWAANLKFVGDMFIRLIQMSIVPLVMASVIVATGSMTGSGTGKIAVRMEGFADASLGHPVRIALWMCACQLTRMK